MLFFRIMQIEATHLGQKSQYPDRYDKSVLVAVPRAVNRELYGLKNGELPFTGCDVWHAYEFGFITHNGLPVTAILKIIYPSDSIFLVESKSLKLYLNSFNMERLGLTPADGLKLAQATIATDLTSLLGCEVSVTALGPHTEILGFDFGEYSILEESDEVKSLLFKQFTEAPSLLVSSKVKGEVKWGTYLLRSNCKITHQPDWGSVFLSMKGNHLPTREGVLQYIVSLRNENHFHEEICEMIYKRLYDQFSPEGLMVCCLYTRRGGIDICPARASHSSLLPKLLTFPLGLSKPLFRQ